MIREKKTETACIICIILAAVFSVFIMVYAHDLGSPRSPADDLKARLSDDYTELLFDDSYVHEIDIIISDLNRDYMMKNAVDEQYVRCDAVIDGERFNNVAIRPKGNSSLAAISNSGDDHFSFKIEFDANDKEQTYHGLDKLSLGNLGQDPSCMKDFLAYHMMNKMEVPAPLSSYTLLKINGEEFGLYLAAEAIEDSFCFRNYGSDFGQLYKPDSFSMDSLQLGGMLDHSDPDSSLSVTESIMNGKRYADKKPGERVDILGDMVTPTFAGIRDLTNTAALNYMGDDVRDYDVIFNTSVFDITQDDKQRFVNAVKALNTLEDPSSAIDTDVLLRYFAVHDFVNNYDSYNSLFVHNFYVHEKDGRLSLIPWDYNLAFGTFTYETALGSLLKDSDFDYIPPKGKAMTAEMNMVNYPIDTPTYSVDISERPLLNVLLSNEETLDKYHQYCDELMREFYENGHFDKLYSRTYEQIRPYIQKGLTFYTEAEFEKGAAAIFKYCTLRSESVRGQLDGSIPSTAEGQAKAPETLIDTGDLSLTDLAYFSSLVQGLDSDTMNKMLNIILRDDFSYDTEGVVEAVMYYVSDKAQAADLITPLLKIPIVKEMIGKKIVGIIEMPIAVILLLIALSAVKKYKRRRRYAVKT